ncbi:MAG: hypothetical protein K6A30_08600 [Lachnospiraceae bacterium]|nr:hypothetical protein [Lachnospiraceae bacterium]
MAGADGRVKITIDSEKTPGVDRTFYDNYMLQISMSLNNEKAKNVKAKDATIADAGEKDFEMDAISIAALPFTMTMDMPDSDSMLDDMSLLTDGVADLDGGVGEFKDGTGQYIAGVNKVNQGLGTVNKNFAKVAKGGNSISKGSGQIAKGLDQLGKNGKQLQSGSGKINQSLDSLEKKVNSMDLSGLSKEDAAYLKQMTAALAKSYSQYDQGLDAYIGGVSFIDKNYSEFDRGLKEYTGGVSKLSDGVDQLSDGMNQLSDSGSELYGGACKLKKGTAQMNEGVSQIPEKTEEKINEMMSDYVKDFELVSFEDKNNENINAVQFTITTPDIKKPKVAKKEVKEEKLGFIERVKNLFS